MPPATKRLSRYWPVAVALLVILLHLPYLFPGGPWARLDEPLKLGQDEGTVLYDSWRIDRGEVMYRDFFEFQGPVFFYLHAGLFKFTGPSIGAARAVHLLVSGIGAALVALLVARFVGWRAGLGAAAIHAFILLPMWPFAYPHWLAETCVLAALAFLTRAPPRPRDQVAAGVLLGTALFTIQSVGLPALAAVTFAAALPGIAARSLKLALLRPARIVAGAGAVALVIAVYFLAHHALHDLYWSMFVWPMKHYRLGQGPAVTYAWFVDEAIMKHALLDPEPGVLALLGFGVTYVLPFFAIAAALLMAPLALYLLWKKRNDFNGVLVAAAAVAGVSPIWLAPIRPDLTHVAYLGSFGLLGAGVLAGPLVRRSRLALVAVQTLFIVVGAGMLGTYLAKTGSTWQESRAMGSWREEALKLGGARYLDKTVKKNETIVVGALGGFYYLYVRPSAIPNTYIPATYSAYLADAQWRKIADQIVKLKPGAMMFYGVQWGEIVKRRPELDKMYHASGAMMLPGPAPEKKPPAKPSEPFRPLPGLH